ncbi:MAG: hypothetical protein M3347_13265 [Armatimonadota bacterium]|nr:hypothetical protein [Armatimonadota bacterium]
MSTDHTRITVRVIAKGGKFLGADIGGSLVTMKNAQTGELLASGTTQGGSGNTTEIMQTPRLRGVAIPTDEASGFTASLPLKEPCLVEVTAYGPLGGLQSAHKVSATQWVVPGKDVTGGDGLLLELPGLLVQVLQPATHQALATLPADVVFAANVTMMCGCPISAGGIWDSKDFQVGAQIMKDGQIIDEIALAYTGQTSQFQGQWKTKDGNSKEPQFYEAVVYAYQPASGNSGLGRVTFFYLPPAPSE